MSKNLERVARVAAVLPLLLSVAATPTLAEKAAKKNPFADTPCASDYEQLCNHTRGWQRGWECLRGRLNISNLSEECTVHTDNIQAIKRARVQARERAWQEACSEEIKAHCSQHARHLAIKGCLNRVEVNDDCRAKLPRRVGYQGPGHVSWKDGSEPENYDEELRKRLRPRAAQKAEDAKRRQEEKDAERQRMRDKVRARLEASKQASDASEQAAEESTEANGSE